MTPSFRHPVLARLGPGMARHGSLDFSKLARAQARGKAAQTRLATVIGREQDPSLLR